MVNVRIVLRTIIVITKSVRETTFLLPSLTSILIKDEQNKVINNSQKHS